MENKVISKQVPMNLEAEIGILNCILIDDSVINIIEDNLQTSDFFDNRNRIIYSSMLDIIREANHPDIPLLSSKLEEKEKFSEIGGFEYLKQILSFGYSTSNINSYVRLVKETSLKRKTIDELNKLAQDGFDTKINVNDYLDNVEKTVFELSQYKKTTDFKTIAEVSNRVREITEEMAKAEHEVTGLSTGFDNLNKLTLGFQNGNLIILAARPSMGKSAFALNLAIQTAKSNNNGKACVAVFSLEMPAEQLVKRMYASEASIPLSNINSGKLSPTEWKQMANSAHLFNSLNLFFDDSSLVTIGDIRSKCRKLKASETGLDLVVIDYLQLISSKDSRKSKQEEVSQISRGLKLLARELNIPVIALSQLSRNVDSREDKRPILSDLRDSGSIEQDADIVSFLYREDYYTRQNSGNCDFILAKNRSGATATLKYIFEPQTQKFIDNGKEEN